MKSVLVLGNARSGTSMTAGILNTLGVDFYETGKLKKNVEQNPKGTFENADFIDITSKMHQDYKDGGKPMNAVIQTHGPRLQQLIRKYEKDLWGFKSALTHHFLKAILPMLKNPHIVVVVRNLYDNALSWQVHMKDVYGSDVSLDYAIQNMMKSQDRLMRYSLGAQCPKIFTSYEAIKRDPWLESQRLAKFVGVDPTPQKQAILEFIMPNYSTLKAS